VTRECPHPTKASYATKAAAKLALRRQRGCLGRDAIHVYRCPGCSAFHLGHKLGYRGHKLRATA